MSEVTKKAIDAWKKDHSAVYCITLEDGKEIYIKAPNMRDYSRAFNGMSRGGEIGYAEQLLAAIFLGGDKEVLKDDSYFLSAKKQLDALLDYPEAKVESVGGKHTITINDASCTVRSITRDDLKIAEGKNAQHKPFVTQKNLFERIKLEADPAYNDLQDASMRFPLYQALDTLQTQKYATIKKL